MFSLTFISDILQLMMNNRQSQVQEIRRVLLNDGKVVGDGVGCGNLLASLLSSLKIKTANILSNGFNSSMYTDMEKTYEDIHSIAKCIWTAYYSTYFESPNKDRAC